MAKTRRGNKGDNKNLAQAALARKLKAKKEVESVRRPASAASAGAKQAKDAVKDAKKKRIKCKLTSGPNRRKLDARDVARGVTPNDVVEKSVEMAMTAEAIA